MDNTQIIIIEDDKVLGESFVEIFNMEGYQTILIKDGREALNYLESNSPHVVLLDIHLPNVSGLEILEFIRSSEALATTKVALLSADLQALDKAGDKADLTLVKPVTMNDLLGIPGRFNLDKPA